MTTKHSLTKTSDINQRFSPDKPAESQPRQERDKLRPAYCGNSNACHFGPMRFTELFISSSKLISVYTEKAWQPPTDIYETDKEIVIRSEIAGMKPEEILISVDENRLLITGCRDERNSRAKRNFRQMEINYGKFEKIIEVYCGIEPNEAAASYKDGFLEIIIPKSKKSAGHHTASVSDGHVTTIRHIEISSRGHITGGNEDE